MAEPGYEIRPGRDADVPAILDLMRGALGEGDIPRTEAVWRWKHVDNPFGESPFWVAESESGLVGVRVFLRWIFHAGDRRIRAVRAVDTATHPDFQGKGIFKRLTLRLVDEVSREGVVFVYNTPNEKSRPGYLKMGWKTVGRLSLWVRPSALQLLRHGFSLFAFGGTPGFPTDTSAWPDSSGVLERADLDRFLTQSDLLHTEPTRDYLRWRYLSCPAARYDFASTDPRHALLVVRSRKRRGLRELTLCETLFERSVAGARTLRSSLRQLVQSVAPDYAVAALREGGVESSVLAACGFVPVPRVGPILTVRTLTPAPGSLDPRSMDCWNGSIGDFELL